MNTTFSIIIPVYNVAPYLRECLDSVLVQTFTDWEVICVDDGSTDGSGAILDEYAAKDSRFRVIHQANAGVSVARQNGLDEAKGEYIAWVDPDDRVDAEMLESFADLIDRTKCDIGWHDYFKHETDGLVTRECQSVPLDPSMMAEQLISGRLWGVLWNRVFRRSFLVENNIRFPGRDCVTMEDLYFICKTLKYSPKLAYDNKAYYHYLIRKDSLVNTATPNDKILVWVRSWRKIENVVRGLVDQKIIDDRKRQCKSWCYLDSNTSDEDFEKVFPEITENPGLPFPRRMLFAFCCRGRMMRRIIIVFYKMALKLKCCLTQ